MTQATTTALLNFSRLREEITQLETNNPGSYKPCINEILTLVTKFELAYETEKTNEQGEENQLEHHYPLPEINMMSQSKRLVDGFLHSQQIAERANQLSKSILSKHLAKRNEIWRDLLASEKLYFFQLVSLVETYERPLYHLKSSSSSKQVLQNKDIKTIFQNVRVIQTQAKTIYIQLEGALKNWPDLEPSVGKMFNYKMKVIREEYTAYFKGLSLAFHTLNKIRKSTPEFVQFVDSQKIFDMNGELEILLTLPSLLLLPVLRISEYERVIKELHSHPPTDQEEYLALANCKEQFEQLRNELEADEKSSKALAKELHLVEKNKGDSFSDWKYAFLSMLVSEMSRVPENLVRQGPLIVITNDGIKRDCFVYLFTSVLLVAEVLGDKFKYFYNYYPLHGAEVQTLPGRLQFDSIFSITTKARRKITFASSTTEERASYITDFQALIEQLRFQAAENATQEQESASQPSIATSPNLGLKFSSPLSSKIPIPSNPAPFEYNLTGFSDQNLKPVLSSGSKKVKILFLEGPTEVDERSIVKEPSIRNLAARSISLFPFNRSTNSRLNGPNSDTYAFSSVGNIIALVVCDGGKRDSLSKPTSYLAARHALLQLIALPNNTNTSRMVVDYILGCLASTHNYLLNINASSSSVFAAILLQTEQGQAKRAGLSNSWNFIWASVGKTKAFLFTLNGSVQQITPSFHYKRKRSGALGSIAENGAPNLSDLQAGSFEPEQGQYIFVVTDGVADNLDPEVLGYFPRDLKSLPIMSDLHSIPETWDDLEPETVLKVKSSYALGLLEKILKPVTTDDPTKPVSDQIVDRLMKYLANVTEEKRGYLFEHPFGNSNHCKEMVGQLDDATVLCFLVKSIVPMIGSKSF